jgi:hypothetical protein
MATHLEPTDAPRGRGGGLSAASEPRSFAEVEGAGLTPEEARAIVSDGYVYAYLYRAAVANFGLGMNLPEDAIYPSLANDGDGRPLSGAICDALSCWPTAASRRLLVTHGL